MAGIGKTTLTVRVAHLLAPEYPDGQLFTDLHAFTRDMAPVPPGAALDRMLRALGVPGDQVPAEPDDRAALFRSVLADRRVLIVLDNAASDTQVRSLLPDTADCLVLVTSRRRLAGVDDTHVVSLDLLPRGDATSLFIRVAGPDRLTGATPELLGEVVELCGRLPLAIQLAAARLRAQLDWTVAHLVDQLRDHRHRLGELEVGHLGVATTLDLSYLHLDADRRHGYRMLGLHRAPDIDTLAAAALFGRTTQEAARIIDDLVDAHLLEEITDGRYRFHELVRAHALHTAERDDPAPHRRAALSRLFDHYRRAAAIAAAVAYPYERESAPDTVSATTPTLPSPAHATDWLDAELPNLLAATHHAASVGEAAVELTRALQVHLITRARFKEARQLNVQALALARTVSHRRREFDILTALGDTHYLLIEHDRARDYYHDAPAAPARTARSRRCP